MSTRLPHPSELRDCALTVIRYLQQVNTPSPSGGMKILVIGGYALKHHLDTRDTIDVDFWINKRTMAEMDQLRQTLANIPNSNFVNCPNSFRWMHPAGVEIPVDFVRPEMAPYLANSAKDLNSLQDGVAPIVGMRGLLISKLQSCYERQHTQKAARDATDAADLTAKLTQNGQPVPLSSAEKAIARRALDDLLQYTMQPQEWWEGRLGLRAPSGQGGHSQGQGGGRGGAHGQGSRGGRGGGSTNGGRGGGGTTVHGYGSSGPGGPGNGGQGGYGNTTYGSSGPGGYGSGGHGGH